MGNFFDEVQDLGTRRQAQIAPVSGINSHTQSGDIIQFDSVSGSLKMECCNDEI